MKKTYKTITTFIVLLSLVTFNLSAQLSGTVTINAASATAGTNYQTFTALASALSTSGINGPLTVDVLTNSGPYVEQVNFGAITGVSAQNTITVNGNGNTLTFGGTVSAPWILSLQGADRMNFNNLTIIGTGTYAWCTLLTNGSDYNSFSTCTFSVATLNGTGTTQFPVIFSGSNTSYSTFGNSGNYNSFFNCNMRNGYAGIMMYGLTTAPWITDNSFEKCSIQDFYLYGAFFYYHKNTTMKNCVIERPNRSTVSTTYGVYFYYQNGSVLDGNRIQNLFNAGLNTNTSTTYCIYAYWNSANGGGANRNRIVNNIISNITNNGTIYGMYSPYIDGDIHHNTISLDHAASTSGSTLYGIYALYTSGYEVNVKDNLITIGRGGTGTKYGLYLNSGSISNYNNVYITSTSGTNYTGYFTATALTMANLQSQGTDLNSVAIDPMYTSIAGFNYIPTNAALNNLGTPVGVVQDINFAVRSGSTPDIGAHEFLSTVCSSVPTASTITSPTFALCPGENANLILNGFTSDIGIVYQWLSSTTSSVGPWTTISGANTVLYNTPGINVSTYYAVAMTCTNTVGSNTAVTLLNVAGTTTNTAPYYESFEGIGKTNKYPNCSWYSAEQGTGALTYTASNTLGRTPRTGSNFATFYYLPAGAKHYYTNGIYLNAGVTYSASLWYQTEYYGYNNWTDLSILYGTTQTTTGLVSIVSSNGPAVSNVYKSLSGTFMVPSSGLYYIAVRGTAGSGSCQYLNWDDLRIEIPCSVNAPTMNVSANTTSICAGETVVLSATGADTYTWMPSGNTGNSSSEMPSMTGNIYVIGGNTASGCTATLSQMIYVNPSPNVIAYANTASVCAGSPANLTAFGAISYTWNNGSFGSNITVNPTAATSYTVLGSNAYGCIGTAIQAVGVNPLPSINVSSSAPNEMCIGETQVLTATGGLTYQWVASPSGIILQGAAVSVNPNATTSYAVTGTDANGCSSTANLTQVVSECVGINQLNASANGIKIYPNPTSGVVNIELNNASLNTIEVTDVTGRVIMSTTASQETVNVNLSNLANGIYYVKIQSENSTEVVKVVKQ